jgi:hypothetical protein
MSRSVLFKVNSAGSWANLVRCERVRADEVKAACEIISQASEGSIAFKATDFATGEVIQEFAVSKGRGK